jgi:hypothetical protein
VGDRGLELDSVTPCSEGDLGKPAQPHAAESGVIGARETPIDPDLAVVVEAWPTLPEATRRAIVGLMQGERKSTAP